MSGVSLRWPFTVTHDHGFDWTDRIPGSLCLPPSRADGDRFPLGLASLLLGSGLGSIGGVGADAGGVGAAAGSAGGAGAGAGRAVSWLAGTGAGGAVSCAGGADGGGTVVCSGEAGVSAIVGWIVG